VDFSSKLFYVSREISRSVSGTTREKEELSDITSHLQRLCDQILVPPPSIDPQTGPPPEDAALRKLAENCKAAGEELLVVLRTIQSQGQGKKGKWQNFRAALSTIWKKGDIDAMSRRLESYKSTLILHLCQQAGR
jgi:hypothetical protein